MHGGHACEVAKRAMAMTAEALTKKRSKQADDEAPTPLEAALLARLPGAPAAHAPPSSPHAPERTARPPALCEAVCALSPLELMAHLHALPMARRQPPPNACHAHPLHFLQDAQCLMDCSMAMVLMEA